MTRRVGLDIGARTVRAIALTPTAGGWSVNGHAAVPRRDANGEERPLPLVLAEIDAVLRLGRARVTVAHRGLATLIRFVASAPMPRERLDKLLRLELAQHVEGSGELAADTFAVPIAGDELIHCCVLAQPAQIYDLAADLKTIGVRPARFHHVGAALMNSTLPAPQIENDDLALFVDLDADACQVALIGERRLLACRQVGFGSDAFAEASARSRGEAMRSETGRQRRAEAAAASHRPSPSPSPSPSPAPAPSKPPSAGPELIDAGDDLRFEDDDLIDPSPVGIAAAPLTPPSTGPASAPGIDSDVLFVPDLAAEPPAERSEDDHYVLDLDATEPTPAGSPFDARERHVGAGSTVDAGPSIAGLRFDDEAEAPDFGPEMQRLAEQLYGQLASSLAWFRAQLRTPLKLEPTLIILSGDAVHVPGLPEYLAGRFGRPVELFDPTAPLTGRVPDDGPSWAGALGLALSDARDAIALDLAPDSIVVQRAWREQLVWPFVGAALVLLATVLACWTQVHRAGVERESVDALQAYAKQWNDDQAQLDRLHADKDLLADDLRAIASRMYAGRDLLYAVRALKEQAPEHKELWVTTLETVGVGQESQDAAPLPAAKSAVRGGRRPDVVDSSIDRGAVNIAGFVRFDTTKTQTELNRFFNDYTAAIGGWSFSVEEDGKDATVKLFDPGKTWVIDQVIEQDEQAPTAPPTGVRGKRARPTLKKGEFYFKVQFAFQPTQLSQVTSHAAGGGAGASAFGGEGTR